MVSRVNVVALPAAATVGEARRLFGARGFSRLPVHEGGLDRVVGVLYVKDLVALAGPDADAGPVGPLARPPLFVPAGQPALALLAQLQRERRHLAVVVDEHGGTAGVVTPEDVLEEIVGEIADEFEPAGAAALERVAGGAAEVAGALPLADLNDALDLELAEPGVDTVGGLVTARLGRFARPGDVIEVDEARLEVLRADGARVPAGAGHAAAGRAGPAGRRRGVRGRRGQRRRSAATWRRPRAVSASTTKSPPAGVMRSRSSPSSGRPPASRRPRRPAGRGASPAPPPRSARRGHRGRARARR